MTDPYRISSTESSGVRTTGLLRPVLWIVLILSATANAVASSMSLHPAIGIGFGVVTLACVTTLIVHHYKQRRR